VYMERYILAPISTIYGFTVVFGFAVIKLHRMISPLGVAYLSLLAVGGRILVTVVLTFGGRVNEKSEDIKLSWRQYEGKRGFCLVRRLLRSCNELKIKFGKQNYLDRLTPLVILSTGVDHTIQLTLL